MAETIAPARRKPVRAGARGSASGPLDLLLPHMPVDGRGDAGSLTEMAVGIIRDRILDLTLAPGSRIDERLLMERFALSRTPAREALNRLVAEGLVEIRSNRGAFVRPLDIKHVRQFFDAYFASERMNGFFCNTQHANLASDLLGIQEQYDQVSDARQFLQVTRLNALLHLRIAAATENEYIFDFSSRLQNQARRLSYFIYLTEANRSSDLDRHQRRVKTHHGEIVRAIRRGNNEELVEILTEHAQLFQDRIMRVIGETRGPQFVPRPG